MVAAGEAVRPKPQAMRCRALPNAAEPDSRTNPASLSVLHRPLPNGNEKCRGGL